MRYVKGLGGILLPLVLAVVQQPHQAIRRTKTNHLSGYYPETAIRAKSVAPGQGAC